MIIVDLAITPSFVEAHRELRALKQSVEELELAKIVLGKLALPVAIRGRERQRLARDGQHRVLVHVLDHEVLHDDREVVEDLAQQPCALVDGGGSGPAAGYLCRRRGR